MLLPRRSDRIPGRGRGAGPAFADTPKIDRTIAKEPVYQSNAVKYGLLAFGPEGKERVWLVLDEDTLHVDRNGNGDLTEPGEKVAAEKSPGRDPAEEHSFDVGDLNVGGRTHKNFRAHFTPLKSDADRLPGTRPEMKAASAKDPNAFSVSINVDVELPVMKGGGVGGRVAFKVTRMDLTGVFQFADTPATAPVVCFGGPLQVTFWLERPTLRIGRESEFVLVVGTPGVGPGTLAMVEYEGTIPEDLKPVAELTYAPARPGDAPIREKIEISTRC